MMTDQYILLIAFRESAKTLWLTIKMIHNISYRKKRFMMYYCFDKKKSNARLYDIVVQLQTNRKLIRDFGNLFPDSKNKQEETQKKSISEFITSTGVKCKAMSIGESPRGEMFMYKDGAFRPDFVGLDDIDVDKSVINPMVIDKNYNWLKGELMGGLSDDAQIIFLGNVIRNDGIVPRFEKDYRNNWRISKIAIIKDGEITWKARYTNTGEEDKISLIDKKKLLGEISYNQNFLLIPFSGGESIVKREHIKYFHHKIQFDKIAMGVDPAISEKTKSDPFAIVVVGKFNDNWYILEALELLGSNKDPFRATQIVKGLYDKWQANVVNLETVAFQLVLSKLFKEAGMAVKEMKPHKDKITRLMEKQALFEQGKVHFSPDETGDLVKQLLDFPNVKHDDLVDALVYAIDEKNIKRAFFMSLD